MTLSIGFLIFPNIQQLDLTGPYEIFASIPSATVHLLGRDLMPVRSVTGLSFMPTLTLEDCPPLDILCIPGGAGVNPLMQDAVILDFIRRQASRSRYVSSVCTGALLLGAAGLLRGRRATTHWMAHDLLASFGAIPVNERVVRDGNLFTGAGVTAGIDFGFTLVAEVAGQAIAEQIQLQFEYAPAPPFPGGTPDHATPAVLAAVRERLGTGRKEREKIVGELKKHLLSC